MAVALGKRKRVESKAPVSKRPAKEEEEEPSDSEDLRDAFRRAFEAKFKPLSGSKKKEEKKAPEPTEAEEHEGEDDDWDGISEEDEDSGNNNTVEVVEVTGPTRSERMSKAELKAFMSSKPPTAPTPRQPSNDKAGDKDEDADADALNLKNDLALQRLLKESHLLDASSSASLLAGPSGKNRHKATDLRIQALGSKGSILAQGKMPMAHRKGIKAKASEREEKRRREARENGIILERAKKEKVGEERKRERGVGGPGVGKFSGAE
ncbi:pre-rRNA processing and 40S ribosomal subunit assembly [Neofusicoccum ribis]|uniref:Pre-rRNA processing and 40S ribosomal subunit assembly n=1 Tax=Neofusicoccum ribis TaxID=45134 RepID=A0ABR3SL72_9PEZI